MKMSSASIVRKLTPKVAPRVALVRLDAPTVFILRQAFERCGIQTVALAEDFGQRLIKEKFEGCVVLLNDEASAVLEAVRSSRSNQRMILYGILLDQVDVRRFSKYGINAILDSPLDRSAVLKVARSTCALLLNELRRYVRIPLVIEVTVEGASGKVSGSSREISGGGISVQLPGRAGLSNKLRLSFSLPKKPPVSVGATVCWQNKELVGFQFQDVDPSRQPVKDWINSFLGLD